jgi:hypothetical protein
MKSRVTPTMNLSAEDVRGYLGAQLDLLDNKRLKVGDVTADDGTSAPISLLQRRKVTGTLAPSNTRTDSARRAT